MTDHSEGEFHPNHDAIRDLSTLRQISDLEKKLIFGLWQKNDRSIEQKIPNLEIVGVGRESILVRDPHDEKKVIGIGWGLGQSNGGILPFAEAMHLHGMAKILFPDKFAGMHYVTGGQVRSSIREYVEGEKPSVLEPGYKDDIENQLRQMGIDIGIDGYEVNFVKENDGNHKYVDFIDGEAFSLNNFNVDKVRRFFCEKYKIANQSDLKRNNLWKELLIHARRLKELDLSNEILEKMSEHDEFDLNQAEYVKAINDFDFLGNQEANDRSRRNIKILLTKAIHAVLKLGYKFKDKRWQM